MTAVGQQDSLVGAQYIAPQLASISRNQALRRLTPALSAFMLVTAFAFADCKCHAPDKDETTHWGGNEMVVVKEENSYRQLRGTIEMSVGGPLKDALIEVFDHPDYLLDLSHTGREGRPEQKRLAVCRTTADGKFCFRGLPPGKYELRSSVNTGWDVTHVYVVLDKKVGQGKALRVLMHLGT
jgi:hypothetical protein